MSYEVYIDVRHHPKHCDDWERKESYCYKLADVGDREGMFPTEEAAVAYALREFADRLDPEKKRERERMHYDTHTYEPEFRAWPKIARLNREVIVTEKIDGTNAAVIVSDDGTEVFAQSRKRLIEPGNDNFGFAHWVQAHRDELLTLGPGHHFGEWYGKGIQCGYGLDDKRFMLFNTSRWEEGAPGCCEVASVLYQGPFVTEEINLAVEDLCAGGSVHVPGWDKPEGVVAFHVAANLCFKVLCENDEGWKGN